MFVMLERLKSIFYYYDSEKTEVGQGLIWLLMFPIFYTLEMGFNYYLVIPSILLGAATIKAVCLHTIQTRKILAFGNFLFSTAVVAYFFIKETLPNDVYHWVWVIISFFAFFNLTTITRKCLSIK
jgi:hypothetical protein